MDMIFKGIDLKKILETLNIGRGFRFFGGVGLLIALWTANDIALKISLITFIFGAFSKAIEMFNKEKIINNNYSLQAIFWLIFTIMYILLINTHLNIIKSPIMHSIYSFFDNSTVAAVSAILIGAIIATSSYKKQKQIDRELSEKREIRNNLIALREKIREVYFVLDRSSNTYQKFFKGKGEEKIKEFTKALSGEIKRIGNILNEEIPILESKIEISLIQEFPKGNEIRLLYGNFKKKLKEWCMFALENPLINSDFFTKRASEIPKLNINKLEKELTKIIKKINKI